MSSFKRSGVLLCLCGPAGSGKSTLCQKLLKEFSSKLHLSVSATSREKRESEQDGVHYFFLSKEEFQKKIEADELFEYEETHGNLYGTLMETVDGAREGRYDLLLDVDIRGALTFKQRAPENTVIVFIVPPESKDLRERLLKRGDASQDVEVRMNTAKREYLEVREDFNSDKLIDYLVVNDDLEATYGVIRSIYLAEQHHTLRWKTESAEKFLSL